MQAAKGTTRCAVIVQGALAPYVEKPQANWKLLGCGAGALPIVSIAVPFVGYLIIIGSLIETWLNPKKELPWETL